jgi:hypothetical protein
MCSPTGTGTFIATQGMDGNSEPQMGGLKPKAGVKFHRHQQVRLLHPLAVPSPIKEGPIKGGKGGQEQPPLNAVPPPWLRTSSPAREERNGLTASSVSGATRGALANPEGPGEGIRGQAIFPAGEGALLAAERTPLAEEGILTAVEAE